MDALRKDQKSAQFNTECEKSKQSPKPEVICDSIHEEEIHGQSSIIPNRNVEREN